MRESAFLDESPRMDLGGYAERIMMSGFQPPVRVGFVLHLMQVAGAEVLVAETIRRLGSRIEPVVLCLDGIGQLGARLQAEGIPVIALGRRPGLDLGVARRLASVISERQLEVVHAHQYTPFFYAALAKPLVKQRIHLIFTEHGRHYPDLVSWKRRLLNRAVLSRAADEINGVCRFSADSLATKDGFSGLPIGVIPNGIDMPLYATDSRADAQRQLGLRTDRRYIACVARFHPVKDHAMLLRAFATASAGEPGLELLLAGDGPLRSALEAQAFALGIQDRVHFLGVRDDVPVVLSAADLFVLTSVSEAASLTLLEAMGTGIPVVVTAVGGNAEIVEHGVHGYLVPRGDDEAMSRAMVDILSRPDVARAMGEAGRHRVRDQYQLDHTVQAYGDLYTAASARLRGIVATPVASR